ncbi:MAG: dihydrolipoamide acetyltransferase family protein [Gemmatimonadota bacterium]
MSRIEVPMPQMGESIAEGTVSKWLKTVGDAVERDEPILEISTDKVDAEIPAPAAGTLVEISVQEGETVEVGTVVAFIDTEAGGNGGAPVVAQEAPEPAAEEEAPEEVAKEAAPAPAAAAEESAPAEPASAPAAPSAPAPAAPATQAAEPAGPETADERLRRRSTPLVRRIAAEHGVDIGAVPGTGRAGRVTKQDILAFVEGGPPAAPTPAAPVPAAPVVAAPAAGGALDEAALWQTFYGKVQHPEYPVRDADRVEPMSRMRKLTADHMVRAKRIAPHVHSFIEVDFTAIDRARRAGKARWAEKGVKVSFTAFVAQAVARVLPEFPTVNGVVSGDNLVYRGNVNLGIAVDLNPGLIVPVIRNADELTLVGVARAISDLAARARDRKLMPDEIQGATFSITNPGVLGTYVGMPVIPEGTAAILGTGAIEKRPVVVEVDGQDAIVISKRSMFSLGYDHRIVDGADAARFLARLKEVMESVPEDAA